MRFLAQSLELKEKQFNLMADYTSRVLVPTSSSAAPHSGHVLGFGDVIAKRVRLSALLHARDSYCCASTNTQTHTHTFASASSNKAPHSRKHTTRQVVACRDGRTHLRTFERLDMSRTRYHVFSRALHSRRVFFFLLAKIRMPSEVQWRLCAVGFAGRRVSLSYGFSGAVNMLGYILT